MENKILIIGNLKNNQKKVDKSGKIAFWQFTMQLVSGQYHSKQKRHRSFDGWLFLIPKLVYSRTNFGMS
jgi:hypothetical protein